MLLSVCRCRVGTLKIRNFLNSLGLSYYHIMCLMPVPSAVLLCAAYLNKVGAWFTRAAMRNRPSRPPVILLNSVLLECLFRDCPQNLPWEVAFPVAENKRPCIIHIQF